MKDDNDRVFDVSKPNRVGPDPTGRPIIVGHHPMTADPMVNAQPEPPAQPAQPAMPQHRTIPIQTADDNPTPPPPPTETPAEFAEIPVAPHEPTLTPAPEVVPQHPESVIASASEPQNPSPADMGAPSQEVNITPAGDLHLTPIDDQIGHPHHMARHGLSSELLHQGMDAQPEQSGLVQQAYHKPRRFRKFLVILVLLVAAYLLVDALTSVNLPFQVFKSATPVVTPDTTPAVTTTTPATTTPATTAPAATDPYASWTPYSNPQAKVSFKYPNTWVLPTDALSCPASLLLLGANKNSVGKCSNPNDTGQMAVGFASGDKRTTFDLTTTSYKSIVNTPVTVDSVTGQKEVGLVTDATSEGKPVGTKVTQYVFYNGTTTYAFAYAALAGQPDVLSDFNHMVVDTLKFSAS